MIVIRFRTVDKAWMQMPQETRAVR